MTTQLGLYLGSRVLIRQGAVIEAPCHSRHIFIPVVLAGELLRSAQRIDSSILG